MASSLLRRPASSPPSRAILLRVCSKARAMSPISSGEAASAGAASTGRPSARARARLRSRYSGCSTDLAVPIVAHTASPKTVIIMIPIATAHRMDPTRMEPSGA